LAVVASFAFSPFGNALAIAAGNPAFCRSVGRGSFVDPKIESALSISDLKIGISFSRKNPFCILFKISSISDFIL